MPAPDVVIAAAEHDLTRERFPCRPPPVIPLAVATQELVSPDTRAHSPMMRAQFHDDARAQQERTRAGAAMMGPPLERDYTYAQPAAVA
jgi:hypothetical protein